MDEKYTMDNDVKRKTFNQPDGVELKEHLEKAIAAQGDFLATRIAEQRAFFESKLAAMDKAVEIALNRLDERLLIMNEFRAAMGDMGARMITRSELDVQIEKITSQIDDLKRSRDELAGKASQKSADIALIMGGLGILMGLAGLLLSLFGG